MSQPTIIEFDNYKLTEARAGTLLDVRFVVDQPGLIGIVGPDGAGKSLLLTALSGRIPRGLLPSGEIKVNGQTHRPIERPINSKSTTGRGSIHRIITQGMPQSLGRTGSEQVQDALRKA